MKSFHPEPILEKPFTFYEACYDLRSSEEDHRLLMPKIKFIASLNNKWSIINSDIEILKKIKGTKSKGLAGFMGFAQSSWHNTIGTILKSETNISGIVHPDKNRYISLSEAKRCSSFPDEFIFLNRKTGIERIGNCVPPLLMFAVANNLRKNFLDGKFIDFKIQDRNYKKILAWIYEKYKEKKDTNAPTVISLFAGCGGSSLGYSLAGFNEMLAVEINDNAFWCLQQNFPELKIFHDDIKNLTISYCKELLQGKELDCLDGSPPCQGFSMAGKRNAKDNRNFLFLEYCRILEGLKPKTFVMENVSGMVKGAAKNIFLQILEQLKNCGYVVKCKLLNAALYGVPQLRQRLIFVGVRKDLVKGKD